jgi:hypothetical protein
VNRHLQIFTALLCLLCTVGTEAAITIGAGPAIGTDMRGTTWYQELQDWTAADLRALDRNDNEYRFNDANDTGRDLIAFYSREEGNNYYFRADFFDLFFGAENAAVDLYVAIDCAAGGQEWLPDFVDTRTSNPWEICLAVYNSSAASVYDANFNNIASGGNWLGSYWRSDLDGVEFGINKSVLTNAGWNGTSPLRFTVFTVRDSTNGGAGEISGSDVVDLMNGVGGYVVRDDGNPAGTGKIHGPGILSTDTTGRAKYAAIAHANQSVATRSGTQGHIYTNRSDLNLHPGFIRTIDTHEMLGAPLNMHLSGSLLSSLLWARQNPAEAGYPSRDGPTFVNRLKNFVNSGKGSIIGGVYAEHIMPYFEGAVNQSSIAAFNEIAGEIFGLTAADMKVMHVPERVFHTNTAWAHANPGGPLKGRPFDDIVASGYAATYLDEVTHLHWWFYPNEQNNPGWDENNCGRWAGGQGNDEEPYHHKLHKVNGVLCFMINDREDQSKFGNSDGGMLGDTRYALLDKALSADYAKITIVFDDWEAFAGNSFASSTPNGNADQWHNTIRWAANHPWIEILNLKDVVTWAQSDPNWVVDHGNGVDNKTMQNYEWLKRASEHSYDNWYYGSGQEQDFFNRVPATAPNGSSLAGTKKYGDMNTPGTLLRDSWDKVAAMPSGELRSLAEWTYSAMIYETAWHDEDANPDQYQSRNYQASFNRQDACTTSYEDTTWDPISSWALRLHGHARKVGIHADAAQWVSAINSGTQGPATVVEKKDVDDDLHDEYILKNNRVYLCIERWGGRLVYAFTYNPVTQDAEQVIGVPVANPAEEHDGEGSDNNRCSAFKDRYATGGSNNSRYVDMDYAATAPVQGVNYWEFVSSDGQVQKRITLPGGRDAARASYTLGPSVGDLYVRHGLGPNQHDLLRHGDTHLSVQSDAYYYGLSNSQGGAAYAVSGANSSRTTGTLPGAGYQNRELPLIETVEVHNNPGQTTFSTWLAFSQASAQDVDGDRLTNAQEATLGTNFEDPDTDGNGMSDGFEHDSFGTATGNNPNADPDGDGESNLRESIAGTSPLDPLSALKIRSIIRDFFGAQTITWPSVAGKFYRIRYTDNMVMPFSQLPGAEILPSGGTNTSYTDASAAGLARRFYRVEVLATP